MSKSELDHLFDHLRQQLIVWAVTAIGLAVMRSFLLPQLLTFVFGVVWPTVCSYSLV
ncbi:hypothetical protein P3T69_02465 [Lactiplantibacillus plantarum]|nr:hypothetical protein P3T69_02465 [Lactiplantibacillus plantarum]